MSLLHITKDSYAAIQKNALHVGDESRHSLVENCLKIKRNDYTFFTKQWLQGTRRRLEEEKNICTYIDRLLLPEKSALEKNNKDYFEMLQLYKIRDKALSPVFNFSVYKKLILLFGSPMFVVGYLLNCLPVIIAKAIADTKVNRVDFYSWVYVSCATFSYLLWLLVLFTGFLFVGWQKALAIVIMTLAFGVFVHRYLICWVDFVQVNRLRRLKNSNPAVLSQMRQKRNNVLDGLKVTA